MAKACATSKPKMTIPARFAVKCIHAYQWIASPWVGNQCRFYPSCSHYAVTVFEENGFIKGSWLTLCRLAKCHPWHKGGIDLPPDNNTKTVFINKTDHA
jgi:putative membrane protein insertion efficiency factor